MAGTLDSMEPRATFDAEAGALVVELADGVVSGTITYPDDAHLVDVDSEGRVLSLEILEPDCLLIDRMAARFGFEDQADAVFAAIQSVLPARTTSAIAWDLKPVQALVKVNPTDVASTSSASVAAWAPAREFEVTK
jgi:uncharacterized protein YuzE